MTSRNYPPHYPPSGHEQPPHHNHHNHHNHHQRHQHHRRGNQPYDDGRDYMSGPDESNVTATSTGARDSIGSSQRRSSPPPSLLSNDRRYNGSPPRGPATMDQPQNQLQLQHQQYHHRGRRNRENEDSADIHGGDLPPPSHHHYRNQHHHRQSPPPHDHSSRSSRYRDRDREGYHSPHYSNHDRSRSRSPRRRDRDRSPYYGGAPSREVILEALPVQMTEQDIRSELEQYYNVEALNDVRVIRDRKTGQSRQFGFLRFADIETSMAFMEQNFPSIRLYGDDEDGHKVSIAFSRERDDRDRSAPETDWVCSNCSLSNYPRRMECFRCQATKAEYSAGPTPTVEHVNTGDSDASLDATPSQFLLLRGLESSVSEELLAKGVAKLYKASETASAPADESKKSVAKISSTTANLGAQEGSIRRVFVVRDRQSDESWKYGFAEFHTVEDAQAGLTKFNSVDKFTIASKPVLVSYIHAGVFIPASDRSEAGDKFSFSASTNPSLKLAYWDRKAYLRELIVSDTAPGQRTAAGQGETADGAGATAAASGKEAEATSKKRKADSSSSGGSNKKTLPSHLQFWKERHNEIHRVEKHSNATDADHDENSKEVKSQPEIKPQEEEMVVSQSYADLQRKCCYLCSRQFKSEAEVNKHERLSQLHRDNLKNEELKSKALAKLAKASATGQKQGDGQEYRDRAKERRTAYGQPKKPRGGSSSNNTNVNSKGSGGTSSKSTKQEKQEEEEEALGTSKGASLLGKMGWSKGQGLGAQGTGMMNPIATDAYVQGVGLGAQGGKLGDAVEEAERRTKGDSGGFLQRTKDIARDRFESMKEN